MLQTAMESTDEVEEVRDIVGKLNAFFSRMKQ